MTTTQTAAKPATRTRKSQPAKKAPAKAAAPKKSTPAKAAPAKPTKPTRELAKPADVDALRTRARNAVEQGFKRPALVDLDPSITKHRWYAAINSDRPNQRVYSDEIAGFAAVLQKIESGAVPVPVAASRGASSGPTRAQLLEIIAEGKDADDETRAVLFGRLVDLVTK